VRRHLLNLSTRKILGGNGDTLIVGFVVAGERPREMLIRAVGGSLAKFGVTGVMSDPKFTLYRSDQSTVVEVNDYIPSVRLSEATSRAGAFELTGNKDSATVITLDPGAYTVHATAANGVGGDALIEVYDVTGRLTGGATEDFVGKAVNLSTRKVVPSYDTLIVGFVINSDSPRQVLVRAVGPTLGNFGVSGTMADPSFTLYRPDGSVVAALDDYAPDTFINRAVSLSGAFPVSDRREAMQVINLVPGLYTVHVKAAPGTAGGDVLVEVYDLTGKL